MEQEIFLVVNGKLTKQKISDATLNNAYEDPAIEAVFANADPSDYFNQILHIAIHRGHVLNKIEEYINNFQ